MDTFLKDNETSVETAQELGLLPEEFEKINKILGRIPNFTELSIFSVMWSEHCSYKNSIYWLKTLPREGKCLLVKSGEENAGLVDIGNGYACAFKIESHNHPSAIEPYQGAATGVGGIHRDIFTMGARPITSLNSLRFGNINLDKTRWLIKGVVKGIGDYGNSFGIPTVGGEVFFDDSFNTNPLVNALSAGITKIGKTVSAIAKGEGNLVYIVGSHTGKDGIHGATFASEDITDESAQSLPSVQVGDPFQEKLLLEATLEAIETGYIIGMQDMGAAGITCSTSEMSAKGKHGMVVHLDKVPTRQQNMKAWEILLSESQERMLIIVKKGKEKEIEKIFNKWDLNCAIIGKVTNTNRVQYYMYDELVADIPAESLVLGGGTPVYQREYTEPAYIKKIKSFNIKNIQAPQNLKSIAIQLTGNPNVASKQWVMEQYDSMVGTSNMSTNAPSDAAIINIKGTNKAIALTTDCNSRYVFADPKVGTMIAVSEAARNIVCSGGIPVAITNCLNFGNPYNKEVYWQFVEAIKGMTESCKKFNTPVTGGNVSFYNQSSDDGPVYPTPTIGMLGLLDNISTQMTLDFKNPNDKIYLLGEPKNDISSSEYLVSIHKIKYSPAPEFNIEEEYKLQQVIIKLIADKLICSAHDVSDGGIFITLLESAMVNNLGFKISTDNNIRKDAYLFGESQSRVVVSVKKENEEKFLSELKKSTLKYNCIGNVINEKIIIDEEYFGNIKEFKLIYDNALKNYIETVN